jgi:hypothetical protein
MRIKKKAKADKYYIVNLTNPSSIFAYCYPYPNREWAKASIVMYYHKEVCDIYKGVKVILLKLPLRRSPYPRYTPYFEACVSRVMKKRSKGLGIRALPFKKIWEPMGQGEERVQKRRRGRFQARNAFLK